MKLKLFIDSDPGKLEEHFNAWAHSGITVCEVLVSCAATACAIPGGSPPRAAGAFSLPSGTIPGGGVGLATGHLIVIAALYEGSEERARNGDKA